MLAVLNAAASLFHQNSLCRIALKIAAALLPVSIHKKHTVLHLNINTPVKKKAAG